MILSTLAMTTGAIIGLVVGVCGIAYFDSDTSAVFAYKDLVQIFGVRRKNLYGKTYRYEVERH